MTQKWGKIKHEQSKAFYYFSVYRDMGPFRSIDKVSEKCQENDGEDPPSVRQLQRYSSKYDWQERALAYDAYLDEKKRKANEEAIMEMNKRHAADAMEVQRLALRDMEDVTPMEDSRASIEGRRNAAVRTWEIGVKNERLARGEATELISNNKSPVSINNTNINSNKAVAGSEDMEDMEEYLEFFGIEDDDSDSCELGVSGSLPEKSQQEQDGRKTDPPENLQHPDQE